MTIPLAKKVNGKKFMWDGVVYDSDASAQQVMEDYAKDGFEVEEFVEDGQFLVYSAGSQQQRQPRVSAEECKGCGRQLVEANG